MRSIRRDMMLSILAVLVFSTAVSGVVLYYSAKYEMYELFDENMIQIALALDHRNPAYRAEDATRTDLKGEEEYLIQIWEDGALRYSSLPAIPFPLQTRTGRGEAVFEGRHWFYYRMSENGRTVQISQPRDKRFQIVLEVNRQLLVPVLIQLPLTAAVVWFLAWRNLLPLLRISRSIRERSPAFLEKLPLDGLPEEIVPLTSALNILLDQLESRLEMQRRFIADAAHELRTPLTAVKLRLAMLQRAQDDTERNEAFLCLSEAVERSIRLAEQLLVMARQEEPETGLAPPESVELCALAAEAVRQYEAAAAKNGVALTLDAPLPVTVTGEREALLAMIGNLVGNAVAYTQQGGRVAVRVANAAGEARITVADNGPGIPAGERERVFDRFYRIRNEGTGSGLGLSIVRRAAERHGGCVACEDGPDGRGVCFRVTLPL